MSPQRHQREGEQRELLPKSHHGGEEMATCPECDSDHVRPSTDGGEIVCYDCGLVLEEGNLDRGPEWRAFNQNERNTRSRIGAPMTKMRHDKGLTTIIDWQNRDGYGREISSKKVSQLNRLRTWQKRIRTNNSSERNLQFALTEIDRMAAALGIPGSVREVAAVIYRRALQEDLIRGRTIEGVATSCLYAACRQEGIPRSLEEVTEVSRTERKEIGRTYRYLSEKLDLNLGLVDPKEYVPRFASELDLNEEVEAKAKEIIDETAAKGLLSGKSPPAYAAAAIYAASHLCNEKRTQDEVSDVTQVTKITIRNRYQEQLDSFDGT